MIWIPQHMDECPSSGVLSAVLMARFCSFPFFAYVPRYCASWCIIFILCVTSTHLVEPTPSFALRPTLQPQFISNTTAFDATCRSLLFVPPYRKLSSRLDILPAPPFHTCICPNTYFFLCLSFPDFCCQRSTINFAALPRPRRLTVVALGPQNPLLTMTRLMRFSPESMYFFTRTNSASIPRTPRQYSSPPPRLPDTRLAAPARRRAYVC